MRKANATIDTESVAIDPALPVIDTHHHLYDKISDALAEHMGDRGRFLIDNYAREIESGHNVVASIAVEARTMYRASGPEKLRVVGETEFLNGQAAMAASGCYGPCQVAAGIIGIVDFRLGDQVKSVLEAHIAAAPERFKGIRQEAMWDADPTILGDVLGPVQTPEHVYLDDNFRRGFAHLAPLGLIFEAFVLSPQLSDIIDLASRFPGTQIVVNHAGSPVGVGAHTGRLQEEFPQWKRDMTALAKCPNTVVKLGGLGSYLLGSDFYRAKKSVSAARLVEEWSPYIQTTIELFGADRCMFESNMPTDGSGSFLTVCNAYKLMTAKLSEPERRAIFAETAIRVYRLDLPKL